jgi:hypothetical protein
MRNKSTPAPFDEERKHTGKKICRECGKELSGRRTSFCSDKCYEDFTKDKIKLKPGIALRKQIPSIIKMYEDINKKRIIDN